DDNNDCTTGEACQAGTCRGGTNQVCTALDQCHVVGTCDPASGVCSNPNAPNGTTCNDGNACTTGEACQAGTCTGGTNKVCTPSEDWKVVGTGNRASGVAWHPNAPNG